MSEQVQTETQVEQPQTETVNYKDFINEDGSFSDAFYQAHPAELGKHSAISKYKDFDTLASSHISASETISTKIDDWLGSDKEEAIKERMRLAGVPSDPADYEIQYPEAFSELPEDSREAVAEYMQESAAWAHENGVPKDVFEAFVARDLERAVSIQQQQMVEERQAFEEAQSALEKEWGSKYENNVAKSENMAKMLGMDELIPYMENDPELRRAFYNGASKVMSDDRVIEAGAQRTLQTTRDQISELDVRMLSYKGDTSDPEYQALVQKKSDLLKQMPKQEITNFDM